MKNIKVALVGKASTGKTCLTKRMINNTFDENMEPTIGAAYSTKYSVINGKPYHIHFWDTAGSERFSHLLPMYIKGAQIILLCLDTSQNLDIEYIDKSLNQCEEMSSGKVFIVACKSDLTDKKFNFDEVVPMRYTPNVPIRKIFHTSSKSGFGIEELFNSIISQEIILDQEIKQRKNTLQFLKPESSNSPPQNVWDKEKPGCSCLLS